MRWFVSNISCTYQQGSIGDLTYRPLLVTTQHTWYVTVTLKFWWEGSFNHINDDLGEIDGNWRCVIVLLVMWCCALKLMAKQSNGFRQQVCCGNRCHASPVCICICILFSFVFAFVFVFVFDDELAMPCNGFGEQVCCGNGCHASTEFTADDYHQPHFVQTSKHYHLSSLLYV